MKMPNQGLVRTVATRQPHSPVVGRNINMYWIKTKKLKEELRSGTFSERDAIPYVIAQGILIQLAIFCGTDKSMFDWFTFPFSIIALIVGTWYVFKKHNADSATSFLAKYVSLSWVVTIQCILIFTPVAVAIILPGVIMENNLLIGAGGIVWNINFYLIYYYLLGKHIAET